MYIISILCQYDIMSVSLNPFALENTVIHSVSGVR